ncbi:MAG: penicillin-binding protein 1C [Candidatus Zixiibacteriota bacterium]
MKRKVLVIITATPLVFLLALVLFPLDQEKLRKPSSQAVYDQDGQLLRSFLSPDDKWRMPCRLNEVSPHLKVALVAVEDRFFYYHPGINPWSLIRAVYLNIKHRRILSGGSTITMQVARMMEHRERTLLSKMVEMIVALKLELCYSKDEILEFYFNLAPYGGNVEGVQAACYFYFQRSPAQISLGQAALLVAIPNSPQKLNPQRNPKEVKKRRDRVLEYLRQRKVITYEEYSRALEEEIGIENPAMPFGAPHFTDLVHRRHPKEARVQTTLDRAIQRKCEEILREHLDKWRNRDITNGAVVVLENRTNNLRALVGSYDFLDDVNSGQVNGATSPRSPGSTLKPLLYAYGIDRGLITPRGILYDVPVNYAGYVAENYDGKYHGVVTVREALVRSLNVPAALLLAKVGVWDFVSFLQKGGISTMDSKQTSYGLSLILGGCEVSLIELANFYSTLANGGRYRQIRYLADDRAEEGASILSPGASYIVTELLTEVVRPDLPAYWEFSLKRPKVAWKTGTSYGHRDAWSIGYTKGFTVGVWTGNFNGQEARELVGAQVAGPILFDVFNAISGKEECKWFAQPYSVSTREVCATGGMVPNPDCHHTAVEFYLPGISPGSKCEIHKAFYIDDETGYRLCRSDLEERSHQRKIFEIWPSEVATWMQRNGYPLDEVPPLLPVSQRIMAGKGPIIRSPEAACEYRLRQGVSPEYQKILLDASVDNSVNKIFWFLDGELIWSGEPEEKAFIFPETGEHLLVCQDDCGRSTSVKLIIR